MEDKPLALRDKDGPLSQEVSPVVAAISVHYKCSYAHPDSVYEVWEPAERYYKGLPPNRTGCSECNYMVRIPWRF